MDWIEHDGRFCPVSSDTVVRIRPRNGVEDTDRARAYEWDWRRAKSAEWQIVYYQPIEQ